ncbi:hypothetical protein JHK87_044613 [Glycine soja]|nr:hypothetical protein JHK87_044613 [Glycine soja]
MAYSGYLESKMTIFHGEIDKCHILPSSIHEIHLVSHTTLRNSSESEARLGEPGSRKLLEMTLLPLPLLFVLLVVIVTLHLLMRASRIVGDVLCVGPHCLITYQGGHQDLHPVSPPHQVCTPQDV